MQSTNQGLFFLHRLKSTVNRSTVIDKTSVVFAQFQSHFYYIQNTLKQYDETYFQYKIIGFIFNIDIFVPEYSVNTKIY